MPTSQTLNLRPCGHLQPLPPPDRTFERLGINLFGPLPLSTRNNRYVVVAIGRLTLYVVPAPLPTGSSAEVANFFVQKVLLRCGAP